MPSDIETPDHIVRDMRMLIGLNANGDKSGEGLIGDVKILKEDIESINRNLISIDFKLEEQSKERTEIFEKLVAMQNVITANIEQLDKKMTDNIHDVNTKLDKNMTEVNAKLDDKVSMKSLSKLQKGIIVTAGTIAALTAIFGFFSKFFG